MTSGRGRAGRGQGGAARATYPIRARRVYDGRRRGDGRRVLVDRLWPRGLRREDAELDAWEKDLSPSDALRRWYAHDPARFSTFARRYRSELAGQHQLVEALAAGTRRKALTLLTATADLERSGAAVLRDYIEAERG